jgi:TrpR family transcriptional regulator, trp operon repressor
MNQKNDKELIKLLSEIASQEAMSQILSNLLTPQEREEIALRLQIFKGLIAGESQRKLAKKLNVSLATISRGSRELKYGKPGMAKALKYD